MSSVPESREREEPAAERPELSAGTSPTGTMFLHETGNPAAWIRTSDWLEAPDFEEGADG